MAKYNVICHEIGYPDWNPYHETSDKDEAESICDYISEKYSCRSFVQYMGKYYYMKDYSGYNKFTK